MTSFLLILSLGQSPNGLNILTKPFDTEAECRYYGASIEAKERLNGNYSVWFNCLRR